MLSLKPSTFLKKGGNNDKGLGGSPGVVVKKETQGVFTRTGEPQIIDNNVARSCCADDAHSGNFVDDRVVVQCFAVEVQAEAG